MKLLNMLLLAPLLCSNLSFADDQANSTNFMEISIDKMDYKKPLKASDSAGLLKFDEVLMSRSDLTFNMKNKDQIFNSNIKWENSILSFSTPFMNINFKLEEDSSFKDITLIDIYKSQAIVNPAFFSFGGDSFKINMDDMGVKLKNYMTFCTAGNPEIDMASADGIEYGCMTEMSLGASDANIDMTLEATMDYEDGDQMLFKASLGAINITESSLVTANFKKSEIDLNKYHVETSPLDVTCFKDPEMKVFDSDKFKKQCENSIDIETKKLVVNNKVDLTNFYIETNGLSVKARKAQFLSPVIQFVDKESSVTTFGLTLDCRKSDDATVYDLHSMISECITDGEITIDRLVSKDEKDLWFRYKDIMKSGFNPIAHIGDKERDVKNVRIKLNNKSFLITASAYKKILGVETKFNIHLDGSVIHIPEKDQIILKVDEIGVPIGWFEIKWKKTLLGIMKKALVGEMIEFDKDKIIIQL